MQESSVMTEIRKIKDELSEKAREMPKKDFLEFIKKEAFSVKKSVKVSTVSK